MKHEYVDASDLIQTDMRSGNEKKLDAMLDERGANEMGAETTIVLRNIALELMAQLEQDEKTRPASDADMAVYHEISSNYNKDRSALAAQSHPRTTGGEMKPTQQEIIELARELRRIANPNESRIYQHERGKLFEAARMLERFGAGGGGPVAWMAYTLDGKSVCVTDNPADFTDEHKALPLYATPQPETAQREPVAWLHKGGHVQVRAHYLSAEAIKSYSTNGQWQPLSPPTDLRAEYLRGLEDAAKVCEYVATLYSEAARKHPEDSESRSRTFARSRAASQCVEEIRALLKGKQ